MATTEAQALLEKARATPKPYTVGSGYTVDTSAYAGSTDTEMKANFNENTSLPSIYKTGNDPVNEDKEFVKNLFRKVLLHDSEYGKMVGENTSNWEKERVCIMDMIILKLAITEFCCFPYIPVKVTMNEYIEISKYFSTPKSKIFVNGILDRILKKLNDQGAVVKKGIGLLDS